MTILDGAKLWAGKVLAEVAIALGVFVGLFVLLFFGSMFWAYVVEPLKRRRALKKGGG